MNKFEKEIVSKIKSFLTTCWVVYLNPLFEKVRWQYDPHYILLKNRNFSTETIRMFELKKINA